MKIMSIVENDVVNSITGFTMSIFVSGCDNYCNGCFNKASWDYDNGYEIDEETLFEKIRNNRHNNVSFLGGEPLYINLEAVKRLISRVKKETGKKVYLWTGYESKKAFDLLGDEMVGLIDYLITEPFILEHRDLNLVLRGSSNQVIYCRGQIVDLI